MTREEFKQLIDTLTDEELAVINAILNSLDNVKKEN